MDPISASVCFAVVGVAAAADLGAVGAVIHIAGGEIVRGLTRRPQHWHDFKITYDKLVALKDQAALISGLARRVREDYTLTSEYWNWVGTGSSASSRTLYEKVINRSDHTELFTLFEQYLADVNNNGKELEVLLREYIMSYEALLPRRQVITPFAPRPIKSITFIAGSETKGDCSNPGSMDYFSSRQYPWLSLVIPQLQERGYDVGVVDWADPGVDWKANRTFVVGPVWGYVSRIKEFISLFNLFERENVKLLNSPKFMKWNLNKKYLVELQKARVGQIPKTTFVPPHSRATLREFFTDDIIIKGAVDAGGASYKHVTFSNFDEASHLFETYKEKHAGVIVQQFIPEVQQMGELSFVFIGGGLSHFFIKVPAMDEERCQTFYGGRSFALSNETIAETLAVIKKTFRPDLRARPQDIYNARFQAERLNEKLAFYFYKKGIEPPSYMRLDGVMVDESFTLMEIEGIEPYMEIAEAMKHNPHNRVLKRYVTEIIGCVEQKEQRQYNTVGKPAIQIGLPPSEFYTLACASEPLTSIALPGADVSSSLPKADKNLSFVAYKGDRVIGHCSTNKAAIYWEHIESLDPYRYNLQTQIFIRIHQMAVVAEKKYLKEIGEPIALAMHNAGIAILPDHRGHAYGSALTEQQIALCKQHKMSTLFCETTNAYSAAIMQTLNFTPIATYHYQDLAAQLAYPPLVKLDDAFTVWALHFKA